MRRGREHEKRHHHLAELADVAEPDLAAVFEGDRQPDVRVLGALRDDEELVVLWIGGGLLLPRLSGVVPQIIPSEYLQSANSLNGLSQRVTGIVDPSLGATFVAAGGRSMTFALDALSFFISAVCVLAILRLDLEGMQVSAAGFEAPKPPGSLREALGQGFLDMRAGW